MHQWAWSLVGKFIACAGGSSCIFEARDVVIPRVCRSHHGNFTLCTARGPEYTERNPQHKHTCMASGNRKWQDEAEVDEKEKGRRLLLVMELSSKLLCTTNYDALEYHSLPPPRVQNVYLTLCCGRKFRRLTPQLQTSQPLQLFNSFVCPSQFDLDSPHADLSGSPQVRSDIIKEDDITSCHSVFITSFPRKFVQCINLKQTPKFSMEVLLNAATMNPFCFACFFKFCNAGHIFSSRRSEVKPLKKVDLAGS
ncbi:hypothetical protein KCU87_g19, partial [Aureobasidium melanogenum]